MNDRTSVLLEHRRDGIFGTKPDTPQINGMRPVPNLSAQLVGTGVLPMQFHGRVIVENVDTAVLLHGCGHHSLNFVFLRDISSHENRLALSPPNGFHSGLTTSGMNLSNYDLRSFPGKAQGYCLPHPGTSSCHYGNFVCQTHIDFSEKNLN